MSITTIDKLVDAMGNHFTRFRFEKNSVTAQSTSHSTSYWRATGVPGLGSVPTSPITVYSSDVGAPSFPNATGGAFTYLGHARMACSAQQDIEMHDRLAHCGGLSGTSTSLQTITGFDITTLSGLSTDRIGETDLSDVQWWLEWFTATGGTTTTPSVSVTYTDTTTDTINLGAVGTSVGAGRLVPIRPAAGKWIKAVTGVQLSASTGTVGNFGVVATRFRAPVNVIVANRSETYDWAQLGLPRIFDDSALMLVAFPTATTAGTVRGGGKIIEG